MDSLYKDELNLDTASKMDHVDEDEELLSQACQYVSTQVSQSWLSRVSGHYGGDVTTSDRSHQVGVTSASVPSVTGTEDTIMLGPGPEYSIHKLAIYVTSFLPLNWNKDLDVG